MRSVFEYLDYRDVLKSEFDDRKAGSSQFSYRMMAESLGLDTGNLFRILQGESHLPARCHSRAIEYMGFTGDSAEYFFLLVGYARERDPRTRQGILEKVVELRDVARRKLVDQELSFYRDWRNSAVRSMIEVVDGPDYAAQIAQRLKPRILEEDVSRALELLIGLGLVRKDDAGRLSLTDKHLTAGGESKSAAVRDFQRQVLELATDALHRYPVEGREVSTLTFAVDREAFADIREILKKCRRSIQNRIEASENPDRVMQLATALFPLSSDSVQGDQDKF